MNAELDELPDEPSELEGEAAVDAPVAPVLLAELEELLLLLEEAFVVPVAETS